MGSSPYPMAGRRRGITTAKSSTLTTTPSRPAGSTPGTGGCEAGGHELGEPPCAFLLLLLPIGTLRASPSVTWCCQAVMDRGGGTGTGHSTTLSGGKRDRWSLGKLCLDASVAGARGQKVVPGAESSRASRQVQNLAAPSPAPDAARSPSFLPPPPPARRRLWGRPPGAAPSGVPVPSPVPVLSRPRRSPLLPGGEPGLPEASCVR